MAQIEPFIQTISRNKRWYSYFAIRLESVADFDPRQNEYKDFVLELLNRQIDFINTLDCPEDERVVNLRFVCRPDSSFYRSGKIDVGVIVRVGDQNKRQAMERASRVYYDVWLSLTAISDDYAFEPVVTKSGFSDLHDPFRISSVAEILRREDVIEVKKAKRVRGVGEDGRASSLDEEHIYYVYPFLWGANSLSKTLRTMLHQPCPTLLSIMLKPIRFTDELESLFMDEIALVEKYRQGSVNGAMLQAISKNLQNQLLRLEDSPFMMKVLMTSGGPISKGLIDCAGVDITEHAGSPDIHKDVNEAYVFSGGYEWRISSAEREKKKELKGLRDLELVFTAGTVAPKPYEEVRYLFDATQANCAFRLPLPQVGEIPGICMKRMKLVPPPASLPKEGLCLGFNRKEGVTQEVRTLRCDRGRHTYVVGQTGTGKSTLLLNMILQDIENNEGVGVLDPHGELIDDIVSRISRRRMRDVIYVNFEDTERPITVNMLEFGNSLEKEMAVQHLFEVFSRLYDLRLTGGPMFEWYMKNAIYLVMEDPESGCTLLELPRIFSDREFRDMKLSHAKDPLVVDFWRETAEKAGGEGRLENMAPYILSKLSMFLSNRTIRNIVASQKSSIDFGQVMDERKILLVDLCKGKVGPLYSRFLGMIFVNKILMAALGRSGKKKAKLSDFYLYVDEFQNLATDSFVALLSEARKYRLNAILANQYLTQIPEDVRDAILGNVGTIVAFRLGMSDAEIM